MCPNTTKYVQERKWTDDCHGPLLQLCCSSVVTVAKEGYLRLHELDLPDAYTESKLHTERQTQIHIGRGAHSLQEKKSGLSDDKQVAG